MTVAEKSDLDLSGLVIAVLGGDDREQEIARLAALTGAEVRAYGFPWPEEGVEGVRLMSSSEETMKGARIALMPIPGITTDGRIFATEKIVPREDLLSLMAADAHIILGAADQGLADAADKCGVTIHEYEHDQELMLLRAPAIVEAALRIIIENTAITIHDARICVVGMGNIGAVLARTLVALGGRVTVAARNPVQRAMAYTFADGTMEITALAERAADFDMILSTVPAPVLDAAMIDRTRSDCLIMDLSAPPGGVDLDHAKKTGRRAIWARALGRRAPITVGGSQWKGISKIIQHIILAKDRP